MGRIFAFVTLGLGIAIAGAGGALYGVAASHHNDFLDQIDNSDNGDDHWSRQDLRTWADDGWALEIAGWVLMGTGLATLAASIILFVAVLARRSDQGNNATPLATLSPYFTGEGGMGLTLNGVF